MRARNSFALALAIAGLVGCGSSGTDDSSSDDTAAAETVAEVTTIVGTTAPPAAETTVAPVETTPAPVDTTTAEAVDTTDPSAAETTAPPAAGQAAEVELVEWAVNAPATYTAGEVTFNVSNNGNFPHELVVFKGDSYESLPQTSSGAVDDAQLPAGSLIGETARLGSGESEALTVTLTPGNYVLLCNIVGGGSSHAARGQVLSVTVS